jgi:hypothetical protein
LDSPSSVNRAFAMAALQEQSNGLGLRRGNS